MTYLLLASALLLSAIAAFYAVAGLVAIFAASATSIMIMGGALEGAKLVVASWLYRNWKDIPVLMKTYFTAALVILMMLTSMGIFGYLSKAHLDQAVPTGDVVSKLNLIDEKITTQKENVNAARKAITQLDAQVDQTLARTTEASGADRSVQIRRAQSRERASIYKDIETSQAEIAKLNQERAPIASEVRKVEAEVGPIKYIAALLYGDTLDDGLLEKAVRIVIIMIVLVFDPLAVLMLIAWNRDKKREEEEDGVAEFFARGKKIARSLDEGTYEPPAKDTVIKTVEEPFIPDTPPVYPSNDKELEELISAKEEVRNSLPEYELNKSTGEVQKVDVPQPQLFDDWDEDLYKRADLPVPKKTETFLAKVAEITSESPTKSEPVEETIQLESKSQFSAKETEFTITSDIQEVIPKPTNGRPEKYK
jgi:flagellar basal body-associated protein FliL